MDTIARQPDAASTNSKRLIHVRNGSQHRTALDLAPFTVVTKVANELKR